MSAPATLDYRTYAHLAPGVVQAIGYRETGLTPGTHIGVPSASLTLIFSTGSPIEVAAEPDCRALTSAGVLIGGLHTVPAYIRQDRTQSGFQLAVHPLAARRLLGVPAAEFRTVATDGADALGEPVVRLLNQVAEVGDWAKGFALLQRFLKGTWDERRAAPRAEVVEAWRELDRHHGAVPIPAVAQRVGLSHRQLGTIFRAEVGVSPKTVARLLRFGRAKTALVDRVALGSGSVADVAHGCGYADHSHLVRDFQEFTGLSPTQWLGSERQIVQATAPGVEQDLAS